MATLIDSPEWTDNEIYEMQQTDGCEGAAAGASFGGLGVNNQPHQQLANRTAFLKQRQDVNIGNIAALLAFMGKFTCDVTAGWLKLGASDAHKGGLQLLIQWGYYSLPGQAIASDTQFNVVWPIPFPNAILVPPLATNIYLQTKGENTVASVISWTKTGAVFVLDVPNGMATTTGIPVSGSGSEKSNGFSWLAIGY